ncbi:DUF1538 family protein [Pseudoflavonifractor phocaeensis]|nr:DUF1538 family protein [Pseudoflavonifractor phocaeensis]
MHFNKQLAEKNRESMASVLPITAIVFVLSITIAPLEPGTLVLFLFGAVLLVLGMGFFTLGVDMSMIPMGDGMGVALSRTRRLLLPVLIYFLLGVLSTMAEPDLQVLAKQVPAIDTQVLVVTVAVGVGIFLAVAALRIRRSVPLRRLLLVFYALVFCIVPGSCWDLFLHLLLRVGVGLDVSTVNEDGLGRQIACLGYLIQNPRKYPIHGLFGEPMPEVIAHRGKMRRFLLQGITEKPAIAIVCADFFRCPPQRGKAVQMLDQHHLEQHHRVNAGAPIILTIERLHHFIQLCEVHRCIYLSQQMLLRHQLVYDYELYQISIHFSAFQHLSSPLPILPYLSEKAPLQPLFFDRLSGRSQSSDR